MSHIPHLLFRCLLSFLKIVWTFFHSIGYVLFNLVSSSSRTFVQVGRHDNTPASSLSLLSQTEKRTTEHILPCTSPSDTAKPSIGCTVSSAGIPLSRSLSRSSFDSNISYSKAQSNVQNYYPDASIRRNSISASSWMTPESKLSSASSSTLRPTPPSLKSCLKTPQAVIPNVNRRLLPATVHFADPEPMPKSYKWPPSVPQPRQLPEPLINRIPSPPAQFENYQSLPFPGSNSGPTWYPERAPAYALPPPTGYPAPYYKTRPRVITGIYPQTAPMVQEPRWPGMPLMTRDPPPFLSLDGRAYSNQSITPNLSVQSTPVEISRPPAASFPQAQYYPFQHYAPYVYPRFQPSFTPAHVGPQYYMSQDPYSLYQHQAQYAALAIRDLERNKMHRIRD